MEDEENNKDCGCDCENCMKDDHDHCSTGKCEWKKKDDMDMDDEGMA